MERVDHARGATNRKQNAVQAFFLANRFRDHLAAAPINFDGFSGADKIRLRDRQRQRVQQQREHVHAARRRVAADADVPVARPNATAASTAATTPRSSTTSTRTGSPAGSSPTPTARGRSNSAQAGAMGEGWSDLYAKDYLVAAVASRPTRRPPARSTWAPTWTPRRTRPATQGSTARSASSAPPARAAAPGRRLHLRRLRQDRRRPGGPRRRRDLGETLWDLRTAIGSRRTPTLADHRTAMRLSPPEPSFLDMRNAILQADTAGSAARTTPRSGRCSRGGAWAGDASTVDGADTRPVEGMALPPAGGPVGTLNGAITDGGMPIVGATVSIGARTATTDANGNYTLSNLPAQTYAHAVITAPGYDRACSTTWRCPAKPTRSCAATGPPCAAARPRPRRPATRTRRSAAARSRPSTVSRAARGRRSRGRTNRWWSGSRASIDITGLAIDPTAGCGDGLGIFDGGLHRGGRPDRDRAMDEIAAGRSLPRIAASSIRSPRRRAKRPMSGSHR